MEQAVQMRAGFQASAAMFGVRRNGRLGRADCVKRKSQPFYYRAMTAGCAEHLEILHAVAADLLERLYKQRKYLQAADLASLHLSEKVAKRFLEKFPLLHDALHVRIGGKKHGQPVRHDFTKLHEQPAVVPHDVRAISAFEPRRDFPLIVTLANN